MPLYFGGKGQHLLPRIPMVGTHFEHFKGPFGEGSSLIKNDGVHFGQGIEVVCAFKQDALPTGGPYTPEVTQRYRDDQGAWA